MTPPVIYDAIGVLMPETSGINHLGLAVRSLEKTTSFFVELLGWRESGHDETYPRTSISDGKLRLTLWQVDHSLEIADFDRRRNIGLHHVALEVDSESKLLSLFDKLNANDEIEIEFGPQLVGTGPRKHMICREPGGIRVEFLWPGR